MPIKAKGWLEPLPGTATLPPVIPAKAGIVLPAPGKRDGCGVDCRFGKSGGLAGMDEVRQGGHLKRHPNSAFLRRRGELK